MRIIIIDKLFEELLTILRNTTLVESQPTNILYFDNQSMKNVV